MTLVPLEAMLARLETGSRPRGGSRGVHAGVPSIGGEHLDGDGGFRLSKIRYVPESFADAQKKGWIRPGDVLIVKDGATTGRTALVTQDFPFPRAMTNEHVFVCRPKETVNSAYLYYFLRSEHGQRQIRAEFRGAAQGGITRSIGTNVMVPLVPLGAQAELASAVDQQITRIRAATTALTAAAKKARALRSAILGVHFSDPSWPTRRIGDFATVHIGATPSRGNAEYWDGGIPWVSSGEVKFRQITSTRETISRLGLSKSSTELHPPGTVLLAMIGEGKTRGQAAILEIEAATNQNTAAIRLHDPDVLPPWLFYSLVANYSRTRSFGSGNNQPALNKSRVADMVIHVPSTTTQDEAIERAETVLSVLDAVEGAVKRGMSRARALQSRVLSEAFGHHGG